MKNSIITLLVFILLILSNLNCSVSNSLNNKLSKKDSIDCIDSIRILNDTIKKYQKIINKSKSAVLFNSDCYSIFSIYINFIINGNNYVFDTLYIDSLFENKNSCYYKDDIEFDTLHSKYNEFKKLCYFINLSNNCDTISQKSEYILTNLKLLLVSNINEKQKIDIQNAINNVNFYKSNYNIFIEKMDRFHIDMELAVKTIDTVKAVKKIENMINNGEFNNTCIINNTNDTIKKYKK